uniref:Hydrogen voltage-gated channel 1 n=1 Tax=Globisporangium ultimum (strain ATCC 200006 / CBS 805.95 / DAOM BR144) TaxID=431595 RepID=K3WSB3_GLOUD
MTRDARADVAFVSAAKDISANSSDESIEKTPLSQQQTKNEPKSVVNDERSAISRTLNLQTTVGAFLETIEVQVAIVLLIAFDVCCTALEIYLRDQHEMIRLHVLMETAATSKPNSTASSVPIATPSMALQVATRLMEPFTGFTVVFFLIELLVLIGAFQKQFFSHFGYVLDLGVVIGALVYEIYTQSKALRLLGVLRIWRVFRVKVYQLQLEKQAAEDSLKREIDSRGGLEKLLQGYKDEVETLKEALNIAAEAVAEVSISATNYHQYEDEDAPLPEDQSQGTGGEAVDPYSDYYDQQHYDAAGYESYYADPNAEAYSEPLDGEESRDAEAVVGPHLATTEAEKLTQDDEFEDAVEH